MNAKWTKDCEGGRTLCVRIYILSAKFRFSIGCRSCLSLIRRASIGRQKVTSYTIPQISIFSVTHRAQLSYMPTSLQNPGSIIEIYILAGDFCTRKKKQ